MKQCISQICVCGRHRCPHKFQRDIIRPNPVKGRLPLSETKEIYRSFPYQPPEAPIKPPAVAWIEDKPMPKTTTTRDDYPPHEVAPRQPPERPKYRPPKGEVYSATTYKDNYCTGDRVQPVVESCKPHHGYIRPQEKMESRTTQGLCYVPWDKEDAMACRGKLVSIPNNLTTFNQEFSGDTTFQTSYCDPLNPKRELGRAKPDNLFTEGPFQGTTMYKTDFPPKFQPPERMLPRRKRVELPAFKGNSTYQKDFKAPYKISQLGSFAPDRQFKPPDKPFEKRTSYKNDYPGWEASRREDPPWKPNKGYQHPDVPMNNVTSYRSDYNPPPEDLVPEKGKGRVSTLCIGEPGPMLSETSHKKDFVYYTGVEPTQSCKAAHFFKPPAEKFATETIFRSHYTGEYGPPAEKITHCSNLAPEPGPMEKVTMTKKDFQPRHLECPAAIIKSRGKEAHRQYKYMDTCCGHEYYKKLKSVDDIRVKI